MDRMCFFPVKLVKKITASRKTIVLNSKLRHFEQKRTNVFNGSKYRHFSEGRYDKFGTKINTTSTVYEF